MSGNATKPKHQNDAGVEVEGIWSVDSKAKGGKGVENRGTRTGAITGNAAGALGEGGAANPKKYKVSTTVLETYLNVGHEEYVKFQEDFGTKAFLDHIWDQKTTPLNQSDLTRHALHLPFRIVFPSNTANTSINLSNIDKSNDLNVESYIESLKSAVNLSEAKIQFPTIRRFRGNDYRPTGNWYGWEELWNGNKGAVNKPPPVEQFLRSIHPTMAAAAVKQSHSEPAPPTALVQDPVLLEKEPKTTKAVALTTSNETPIVNLAAKPEAPLDDPKSNTAPNHHGEVIEQVSARGPAVLGYGRGLNPKSPVFVPGRAGKGPIPSGSKGGPVVLGVGPGKGGKGLVLKGGRERVTPLSDQSLPSINDIEPPRSINNAQLSPLDRFKSSREQQMDQPSHPNNNLPASLTVTPQDDIPSREELQELQYVLTGHCLSKEKREIEERKLGIGYNHSVARDSLSSAPCAQKKPSEWLPSVQPISNLSMSRKGYSPSATSSTSFVSTVDSLLGSGENFNRSASNWSVGEFSNK